MSAKRDPFRPADKHTECPKCGEDLGWNVENGLAGQECLGCGHTFTGHERKKRKVPVKG